MTYDHQLRKYYMVWGNNCIHSMHYCLEKNKLAEYEIYKQRRDEYQAIIDKEKITADESLKTGEAYAR